MRLSISKSKSAVSFYVIRSVTREGKNSSEVFEKLGTEEQIKERYGCEDAYQWAKNYVKNLNAKEIASRQKVLIPFMANELVELNAPNSFNVGYLFLQQLYCQLKIPAICKRISKSCSLSYDLDAVFSRLIYGRILFPSTGLPCAEQAKRLLEQPKFEQHHVSQALEIISDHAEMIQTQLYKNSTELSQCSTKILYYDCTNYFFDSSVQLGLFLDHSGIPLAFFIREGSEESSCLPHPLEKQIMHDFHSSKFAVCTNDVNGPDLDMWNNFREQNFLTIQSLENLRPDIKEWALSPTEWRLEGTPETFDIRTMANTEENREKIFFKQRLFEGYDENQEIEYIQNLIVIYSLKYKDYQICRRERKAETSLSQTESRYDGFHVVYTNLDDEPGEIVKIIQVHWEIEEFFQIMCPEFKSKDFFSKKSFQLKAHFITSFIALLIYRIAKNRLTKYPFHGDLLSTLKNMNVTALGNDGYVPSYTRTEFTDILHEMAGFRTDSSLTTQRSMREICRKSKKP